MEQIFENKSFISSSTLGRNFKEEMIVDDYIDDVLKLVNVDKIKKRKFKVTMDLGNGVQAIVAPEAGKKLGCVISVNGTVDGNFPGRGSEPTPSNLSLLSFIAKETNLILALPMMEMEIDPYFVMNRESFIGVTRQEPYWPNT